jgi:bifunctional UDP-N-acetylglucosamine pyrophosphorylase/glucosamine-1-phosphate N-acetyltransferase
VFALELPRARQWLERLTPSPATGELYLTQVVELARADGARTTAVVAAAEEEILGVNDRAQLAQVTAVLRRRIVERHLAAGVTVVDPASAWIDARAEIEADARIEPFTVISGPCRIARGAVVGPFAHLRAASLGARARVGNFVEVVRSELGAEARALHLAYLGDAELGDGANVGAGTITANWDGARHHRTRVGARAQLGSNTVLVAPAEVGEGARTGAGSVVTRGQQVPPGATWAGVPARPLGGPAPGSDGGRA